ncbi:IclR family transcriptional regulator [Chelatococcus asaccharovorans]|uniref:IclR family transcriptional regulator n=1 Tax=Chelatococcus asaccharovorans TaxID=28210 RepID=A0A2V3TY58_9HYPH|nr:IclR family transcriptional regulator [Chelatococcus asaccharovorans]PXW54134.1 IclR family transcriptional regulator [Chelatococcus asaccharovorans]
MNIVFTCQQETTPHGVNGGNAALAKSAVNSSRLSSREELYRAPALDKGLDILELLASRSGALTRAEIVKELGRGASEIYRMLERLVARGYVYRSAEGDRFALSMKLFVLGQRHPPLRRLTARAAPMMDAFALEAGQSCHLVVRERDAAVVVANAAASADWVFTVRVGTPIDLLSTSSGQLLLAFLAEECQSELMAHWKGTEKERVFARLAPQLARYRDAGYRIDESQQIFGVSDISVPILSAEGHTLAVLTCPYIRRMAAEAIDMERALALLQRVARELTV